MKCGLALVVGVAVAAGCDGDGGTGTEADYSLSLAPAALTIVQGGSSNTTVTIARTDFTGAVTLSLGGAPAGVTGSFNPAAPTGTSATLTLSIGAAVVPGVYNLTVEGTATAGDRSTPLTLTVSATPDFTLSLAPAALTIVQGANGNTTVTLARINFTGTVTLSLGGAPAGVTGSFNPVAPAGTSTLTVSVGATVAPGIYNLTVDGTGTPGIRSTALTLTVTAAPPDYALSLAPAAFTVAPGGDGNTTVTLTRTNFTGAVTLSLGGAPAGVTGAFNPAAPTGTTSTLTVSVGAGVAPGVYNLTVDGTGTPGNRSTPLTLTVSAIPDYALSLAPTALTIVQGGNDNATVTVTRSNFTGAVTLSLGNAPAGVTGVFDPAAPTGTSSILTVSVGAAVAPGVYNLTVDGTGAPGNRSTPLTLTVSATPDYALSLTPAALTIVQGANGNTAVTLTRTNFTGAVTLSLGGAPAGVTGAFNPAAPTGTSSALTVTVGAAVAPGVYDLTVDGTGAPGNRSTPLTLTVDAAPADYALSLNPTALTIVQGANGNTAVTLTRTNFTDAVTLSLGGAPAGVTGSFNPAAPTGTSSTLTVSVGAAVAPGVYNLTVDGTGTPGNRSTPLTLTVDAAPADYALSLNPAALSIAQGGNAPTTVTITRTNFGGAVTLSLGGAPAGVTGAFNPAAPTGTSSTLTVTVGAAVTPGVYNLTVDGTGTPGNRSTPLTLTVSASGGGNVTLDFSACPVEERPLWVAGQDGAGPWAVVTGVSNVYQFNVASGRGGYAFVLSSAGAFSTLVQFMTQAELTATPFVFCGAGPTGKTVTGTAAGLGLTDQALISLGGGQALVTPATLNFSIAGVAGGAQDLVGYRRALIGGSVGQSAIIRRDQDIADGGSVGTVDFDGVEAFAPADATITVGGLLGGETVTHSMLYWVGAGCIPSALYQFGDGGPSFTASGIPAQQQRVTDFHGIAITAATDDASRTIQESFHALDQRTVTLGAALPAPTITTLTGPYKRLQAAYTLPADYNFVTQFTYAGPDRTITMIATLGYLAGPATTLAFADYSGLAGWDNAWAPATTDTGTWTVVANGGSLGSLCTEGANRKVALVNGTF